MPTSVATGQSSKPPGALLAGAVIAWAMCLVLALTGMIALTAALQYPNVPGSQGASAAFLFTVATLYGVSGYTLYKVKRAARWIAAPTAALFALMQALQHSRGSLIGLPFNLAVLIIVLVNWRRFSPASQDQVGA